DDLDSAGLEVRAVAGLALIGLELVLVEELLHGQWREFDAEHAVALRGQPRHVQRLAGQWHKYSGAGCQAERRPVLEQQRKRLVVVEADAAFLPALVPEFWLHALSRLPPLLWVRGRWRGRLPFASRGGAGRLGRRVCRGRARGP